MPVSQRDQIANQMKAGSVAGLPIEVQQQLLAGQNPYDPRQTKLPPVTSPEYAKMVKQGWIAPPQIGSMDYLDFARANPDIIDAMNGKNGTPSRGLANQQQQTQPGPPYNPFGIISALLGHTGQ